MARDRKGQPGTCLLTFPSNRSIQASKMKWLTHVFLHDLAREVKPGREVRDAFGFGSACWCIAIATSPPTPTGSSHANSQHRPIDTTRDIELHCLDSSGRSRVITPLSLTSELQSWQTPTPLPLRPPMAHCRPPTLSSSNLNNPHSNQHKVSPRNQ